MHIFHIYRDLLKPGGVPHQTRQLISAQTKLNHKITVVCMDGTEDLSNTKNVSVYKLPRNPIKSYFLLKHALIKDQPDLCHITGLSIPEHVPWIKAISATEIPYVLSTHNLLNPLALKSRWEGLPNPIWRRITKSAYRKIFDAPICKSAFCFHAQSVYERECIVNLYPNSKVKVIPLGIDNEWPNLKGVGIRSKLFCKRPITLGYLGRLDTYHKGLDLICDAAENLNGDIKFIFAGSHVPAFKESLISRTKKQGIHIRGEIWGEEKNRFWEDIDFFLGIFRVGGQARAIGEALGNGVPVIATREGNWGDTVQTEKIGFKVDLRVESIKKCFNNLLEIKPDAYNPMSERAFQYAKNYSWIHVAEHMNDLYAMVISYK